MSITNKILTNPVDGDYIPIVQTQGGDAQGFVSVSNLADRINKRTAADEAPVISIGNLTDGAVEVTPDASVIPFQVYLSHASGAGDCDDISASYLRIDVTGDGDAGLTPATIACRAYIGSAGTDTTVANEVYALQPWVKHTGTGTVAAMSAVSAALRLNTGTFTSTNSINAGHFHVIDLTNSTSGAQGVEVTSNNYNCVMMEVYPGVHNLGSVLQLSVDGATDVVGAWLKFTGGGKVTYFANISGASDCVVIGSTMHHSPETVAEDAFLVIKIGATAYNIPLYLNA
jgi:hypothetical protein